MRSISSGATMPKRGAPMVLLAISAEIGMSST
jgi:hypothetical protein